jgi:hypothetical protein
MHGSSIFISDKTLQKKIKYTKLYTLVVIDLRFEISVLLGYGMHHWVMDALRFETT